MGGFPLIGGPFLEGRHEGFLYVGVCCDPRFMGTTTNNLWP